MVVIFRRVLMSADDSLFSVLFLLFSHEAAIARRGDIGRRGINARPKKWKSAKRAPQAGFCASRGSVAVD